MQTTRRDFLASAVAAPAIGPILLGLSDKAGARRPLLGSGAFRYEAIHDWGELPPHITWGNTHNVVEDAQGHIYVHHTVNAASQSPDTVVVFDRNGRFVRSWGRQFRGVAHGMWLRREGREEFLYLTVNAANPKLEPRPELPATMVKATLKGEIVYTIPGAARYSGIRQRALQPDQHRHRAQRGSLRGGRLRLVLHQPLQRQG